MAEIEMCKFTPEDIDEAIVGLDGLQKIIVPLLLKTNHENMGREDAEQFKKHITLAKHALIAMGDVLKKIMAGDGRERK